jgi:hypothetical protein
MGGACYKRGRVGEVSSEHTISVGRLGFIWAANIKMDLNVTGCGV